MDYEGCSVSQVVISSANYCKFTLLYYTRLKYCTFTFKKINKNYLASIVQTLTGKHLSIFRIMPDLMLQKRSIGKNVNHYFSVPTDVNPCLNKIFIGSFWLAVV